MAVGPHGILPHGEAAGSTVSSDGSQEAAACFGMHQIPAAGLRCREGLLDHMAAQGVQAVDCVSVDNALVVPGDPLFAGHCWAAGADCGAGLSLKCSPEQHRPSRHWPPLLEGCADK